MTSLRSPEFDDTLAYRNIGFVWQNTLLKKELSSLNRPVYSELPGQSMIIFPDGKQGIYLNPFKYVFELESTRRK